MTFEWRTHCWLRYNLESSLSEINPIKMLEFLGPRRVKNSFRVLVLHLTSLFVPLCPSGHIQHKLILRRVNSRGGRLMQESK